MVGFCCELLKPFGPVQDQRVPALELRFSVPPTLRAPPPVIVSRPVPRALVRVPATYKSFVIVHVEPTPSIVTEPRPVVEEPAE